MAMSNVPKEFYTKIKVTQIIDPSNFSAQIAQDFHQVEAWEKKLHEYCESLYDVGCDVSQLHVGQLVLVHSGIDNTWKRAEIARVNSCNDDIDVLHIDYGTTEILYVDDVHSEVPEEFAKPGPLALRCRLAGVKPIASSWISRATQTFSKLVFDRPLSAVWLDYQEDVASVAIILSPDEFGLQKSVAQALVDEEVAVATEDLTVPNLDCVQPKKETTQKAHHIPRFKLELLAPKIIKDGESDESEDEECFENDPEIEIRKAGLGGLEWEQSDLTIGKGCCPEANFNIMENIRSEIKGSRNDRKSTKNFIAAGRGTMLPGTPERKSPVIAPGHPSDHSSRSARSPFKYKPTDNDRGKAHYHDLDHKVSPKKDRGARSPFDYRPSDNDRGHKKQILQERKSPKHFRERGSPKGFREKACPQKIERHQRSFSPKSQHDKKKNASKQGPDMKEKLKNEYEWQKYQFTRKVKQVLDKATIENIETEISDIKQIVSGAKSVFEQLPGPKELHLFLEVVLERCVEEYDSFCNCGLKLLELFQGFEGFSSKISELIWKLQHEYVKTTAGNEILPSVTCYCQVLGRIYNLEWHDRMNQVISKCVSNSLFKWIFFNKKKQHYDPYQQSHLFLLCANSVLVVVGHKMDQNSFSEMDTLFLELKEKVLSPDLERTEKEICLELLLLRASGWGKLEDKQKQPQCPERFEENKEVEFAEGSVSITGEDVIVESSTADELDDSEDENPLYGEDPSSIVAATCKEESNTEKEKRPADIKSGLKDVANWIRNAQDNQVNTEKEISELDAESCDPKPVPKYVPPHLRATDRHSINPVKPLHGGEDTYSKVNTAWPEIYSISAKGKGDISHTSKETSAEVKQEGKWQSTCDLNIHQVSNTENWPSLTDSVKVEVHKFAKFNKGVQQVTEFQPQAKPAFGQSGGQAKPAFGQSGGPRVCTFCKCPSHLTFDCPHTEKLFL